MTQTNKKILLGEEDLPRYWYNVLADLPTPMSPPLHPATNQPIGPEDLAPIFARTLIEQEMSAEREIAIPEAIRDVYRIWRPTPLVRATRLEQALGTPAKIYYKNESVSPAGSHKPNTAVAQAYYNKLEGIKRLATETGAGQWGSALSFAGSLFDLETMVYMVRVSFHMKPYRKHLIETWGGQVVPSPSNLTQSGRAINELDPETSGSLGIAISEAVEDAATRDDTNYSLGSVLNHVMLHQTVIGLETKKQFEIAGDYPDLVIGCVGGGSNFAGLAFPFVRDKINGKDLQILAVEPTACPTVTKGLYAYDYGDVAKLTPMIEMYTLGHDFIPPGIHAGGLRYHGMAPTVSHLHKHGLIEAKAYHQLGVFEAAMQFARTEGLVVAPETAHAVRAAIDAALEAKEEGKEKTIVFNLSGHGHFDMASYDKYMAGELVDYVHSEDAIRAALDKLPQVDGQ